MRVFFWGDGIVLMRVLLEWVLLGICEEIILIYFLNLDIWIEYCIILWDYNIIVCIIIILNEVDKYFFFNIVISIIDICVMFVSFGC